MISICYPTSTYNIDIDKIDSDYLSSLVQLDKNIDRVELTLFEDIFKLIVEGKVDDIFELDKEYIFKGLSYFGCSKLLDRLFTTVKREVYDKEYRYIQTSIERFFERHLDSINWYDLSRNTCISEAFFERHIDRVDWNGLCRNTNLSDEFFERHIDRVHWYDLCYNPSVSEEFFEKYIDKINWKSLCFNDTISQSFFERHVDKVEWDFLGVNTPYESFLEQHIDKLTSPIRNSNLSLSFIEKHEHKIDWNTIGFNKNITDEFIEKWTPTKDIYWMFLPNGNNKLSEAFFDRYIALIGASSIARCTNLSEDFFERHLDILSTCWEYLSRNTSLSEEFFERHIDRVSWTSLCGNTSISEAFFEKYIHRVVWKEIIYNKSLSVDFFRRHVNKVIDTMLYNEIKEDRRIRNRIRGDVDLELSCLPESDYEKEPFSMYICSKLVNSILCTSDFNIHKRVTSTIDTTTYYSFDKLWKKVKNDK